MILEKKNQARRHDIDALRVIAIGLLIIYHITIVFQPWGSLIPGFFQNQDPIESLWLFSGLINVWRIPILFVVSGMGVAFSMQKRSFEGLMSERSLRILLPLVFGSMVVTPLGWDVFLMSKNSNHVIFSQYSANPGHLWFLVNIFLYTICSSPLLFYLKKNSNSSIAKLTKFLTGSIYGLIVLVALFALEAEVFVNSWRFGRVAFELYAGSLHGFVMGWLCFLSGFIFIFTGNGFWNIVKSHKNNMFIFAGCLYLARVLWGEPMVNPPWLMAIESCMWMFSIFGYSYSFLNQKNKLFSYLSPAAYPVYITHMLFMNIACYFVLPMEINAFLKFFLVVLLTFAGCLLSYEFLISKLRILRPLFGLKMNIS